MDEKAKKLISEGLLILSLPAIAYLFTFAYEAGAAIVFGIPYSLISINVSRLCISAAIVGIMIGILYLMLKLISIALPRRELSIYESKIFIILLVACYYLAVIYLLRRRIFFILILVLFGLLILIFIEFGMPLFTQRKQKTYLEKLQAQVEYKSELDEVSFSRFIIKNIIGLPVYIGFLILFCLISMSFLIGVSRADNQIAFLVSEGKDKKVILKIYDDVVISSQFNEDLKTLENGIFIQRLGDNPDIFYRWKKIGPLKRNEEEETPTLFPEETTSSNYPQQSTVP